MTPSSKKRSLTGIQPSGNVHIGNYLGAIKPAIEYQNSYDCLYFIADFHALTSSKDGNNLHEFTMDLVATWIALGLDIKKHTFYRQSDVPFVTEYAWYLSCFTGMGLLEKSHAYKDKVSQSKDVNHGLFAYPILMAADILMYNVDIVPVGKDQKQHVEMSRDIAGSVNAILGENFIKLPEPVIREDVMTIPGLDGRKMSKSYGNEIPLFCDEKNLEKKIMSIKSDSTPLEASKELGSSLIGQLYSLFANKEEYADLDKRMKQGGLGWGHAKKELYEVINSHLKDKRSTYNKLRDDEQYLLKVLSEGAEKATMVAQIQLSKLRDSFKFQVK